MQHKPARLLRLVDENFTGGISLRIATATRDFRHVSEPFGRAVLLAVYDVTERTSELVSVIEFAPVPQRCNAANDNPDDCEGRIGARLDALAGCHILALQIGDVAAAAAIKRHLHPIELSREEPIAALLARCQAMLSSNPPPWLRRLMGGAAAAAADDAADAGAVLSLEPSSAGPARTATAG